MPAIAPAQLHLPVISHAIRKVSLVANILQVIVLVRLLDTLDFMVLATVDYAGGLIISDWYSDNNPDEAIKITLRFLDNEVRVDALKVTIHKKVCKNNNCRVKQVESDLSFDIKDKILKKAAYLVKTDKEQKKSKKIKSVISNERN